MKKILLASLILNIVFPVSSEENSPEFKPEPSEWTNPSPIIFSKDFEGKFNGKNIQYTASHEETILFENDEYIKPLASIYSTQYIAKNSDANRPVIFSFNGGPGSASLWLHMGVLGPKVVKVPSNATDDGSPPYKLRDNPLSPLDVADLVFIDPIGTGYSLALGEHENKEFWGVKQDAEIVAKFIRRWINDHKRWNAPKFILGESYGGIRGPLLLKELRNGKLTNIEINGLILVSPATDLQHIRFSPGNNLPYMGYLPSYAASAYFHKAIDTDKSLLEFYEEAKNFSLNEYGPALIKGNRISEIEREALINKLSYFTGLLPAYIKQSNLRVDPSSYRKELLRSQGLSIGRLDARYKGRDYKVSGQSPDTDISSEGFSSAYIASLHTWFGEIGVDVERVYRSSDRELAENWDWFSTQEGTWPKYVNVAPLIGEVMRENKDFRVYLACGIYDLATPCFTSTAFINDNGIDANKIKFTEFEAGHMMYNHQPSFDQFLKETREFVKNN